MGAPHNVFGLLAWVWAALLCSGAQGASARVSFDTQDAKVHADDSAAGTEDEGETFASQGVLPDSESVKGSAAPSYRPTRGPREARQMAGDDEVEEEEELYTQEELNVVNMMRAAQEEEREWADGGWGLGAVKVHFSAQLVLWGILAAAVYVIMKGATRSDEKQKSLDVHRAVLKTTQESLMAGRQEATKAVEEMRRTQENKVLIFRQSLATASRISTILNDIQSAAQASDITGRVGHLPDPQHRRRPREGVSLVVPPALQGCREGSLDLHMLLLNQADTGYQEKVIYKYLEHMAEQGRNRHPHAGSAFQHQSQYKIEQRQADAWFESAATSIGLTAREKHRRPQGVDVRDIKKEQRRATTTERDRKVALLGIASVMLERKLLLEKELQGERQQLRLLSDNEREASIAVKAQAAVVSRRLTLNLKEAKETLRAFELQMTTETEVERAAIAAARRTVDRMATFDSLFGGTPQGALGALKEIERTAQAQRKLMAALRSACESLGLQQKRMAAAIGVREKEKKYGAFSKFRKNIIAGYQEAAAAIACLSSAQILADTRRKENITSTATLREKERTISAFLAETDSWLLNAQRVFGPLL